MRSERWSEEPDGVGSIPSLPTTFLTGGLLIYPVVEVSGVSVRNGAHVKYLQKGQ